MIDDIRDYVGSFDNVRAACGLNSQELSDSVLESTLYAQRLGLALSTISAVYGANPDVRTIGDIFFELNDDDPLFSAIGVFCIYSVTDTVMGTIGLRAYKTIADGKSSITRFSTESTYQDTRKEVYNSLSEARSTIKRILGLSVPTTQAYVGAVQPAVDVVTGA